MITLDCLGEHGRLGLRSPSEAGAAATAFPCGTLLAGSFWRVWWWFSMGVAAIVFKPLALAPASPLFPELANPWLRLDGSAPFILGGAVDAVPELWGKV
ncbi:hypothetical protein [Specibacter sp. NPDC078692]|uniref:hypothetical protein n=1 Tax=Specibacter sp. NPDC078692 TaxID=3155818 RepID=UPI003433452B